MSKIWRYRGQPIRVTQHSGGTPGKDFWRLKIQWTQKTGLYLIYPMESRAQARRVAAKLKARGYLNLAHWKQVRNPHTGFYT